MGQDPSAIREEIEDTRGRMGDTVEAIGYKTDVKSRARDSVSGKVGSVKSKITGATPDVDTGQVKDGARQAVGVAQENPIGLAIGGLAVGFLAGMLVPSTRVENERIGPIADDVKDKAREAGQEAVERGKHVAQQAAESAKETAQEAGQQQVEEVKRNGQSGAEASGSTPTAPATGTAGAGVPGTPPASPGTGSTPA